MAALGLTSSAAAASAQDGTAGNQVPLFEEETSLGGERSPVPAEQQAAASAMHNLLVDRRDPRTVESFRHECRNEYGRRELTLFANGTVRLREGLWQSQSLMLTELLPEDLQSFGTRLMRIRRSPNFPRPWDLEGGPGGPWTEDCVLHLDLPGTESIDLEFGNHDALPLELGQLEQISDELARRVRPLDSPQQLPLGYEPVSFDLLRGVDGKVYRVIGLTDDGKGLEMESLHEPLRTYFRLEDLRSLFVEIVGVDGNLALAPESSELESFEPHYRRPQGQRPQS